jgi:hypothetical protein
MGVSPWVEEVPQMLAASATSGGFIGLWAVIYFVLMVTLGIMSIRKGHWVMFLIGIFLPLFWLIGALLPRRVR